MAKLATQTQPRRDPMLDRLASDIEIILLRSIVEREETCEQAAWAILRLLEIHGYVKFPAASDGQANCNPPPE